MAVRLISEALSCGGRTFAHAPSIKAVVIKCWLRPSSSRYSVEQSVLCGWAPSSVLLHLLLCPVCNKNKGVLHFSLLFLPRCCNTCECCSVDSFFSPELMKCAAECAEPVCQIRVKCFVFLSPPPLPDDEVCVFVLLRPVCV